MARPDPQGFSLVELLVAVVVLGLLATIAWPSGREALEALRLEAGLRGVMREIDRRRDQSLRQGEPQLLPLEGEGGLFSQALEPWLLPALQRRHSLPEVLRITANGLVIDGGTLVLAARTEGPRRCLVISLPLGVMRLGRYSGSLAEPTLSGLCERV